ncbi:unnamed protein product [Cryptosporidium hominis]|uniref:Uncharacterized protein n=2 Tax=Cryptosporidium TaxID=5806 RepID=A0A7S7LI51_CRYPV|nr:hypothetical protein CPATCC_0019310 [Cryptosporidium parvum]WRK31918.1 hypothetical protein cpbgf_4003285 [Cryptosporidium parvum]CUV05746.1 unnamed protein product [Cryptosporidium hominis]|eukprot:QOY42108.1 hypothetical protein CPATCC_001713 [Cryptosporidium parvum]
MNFDPLFLFKILGCCRDPPVEVAQPSWWEEIRVEKNSRPNYQ